MINLPCETAFSGLTGSDHLATLRVQSIAVCAEPEAVSTGAPLVGRNVAPGRTPTVVVIDTALVRFGNFVDRVKVGDSWHFVLVLLHGMHLPGFTIRKPDKPNVA